MATSTNLFKPMKKKTLFICSLVALVACFFGFQAVNGIQVMGYDNTTKTVVSAGDLSTFALKANQPKVFNVVTATNGEYVVNFGTTYSVVPNVQTCLIDGLDNQNVRVKNLTTSSVTVWVRNRVDVVGLLPTWTNVNAAKVHVSITPIQ